jgi:hypothetical protein
VARIDGAEGGHFFVPGLNEFNLFLGPAQRSKHAINTVPRTTKDPGHPPFAEPRNQKVANCRRHVVPRVQSVHRAFPTKHPTGTCMGLDTLLQIEVLPDVSHDKLEPFR